MPTGSGGAPAARRGERGYTLAVLVGILTVIGLALAAAAPHWAARVQREREAELVARGLQYAEAIRVFQRRFGRLPNALEELVELEPRSIRRLWRNPFAKGDTSGWAVLVEVGGQVVPVDPATGVVVATSSAGEADEGGRGLRTTAVPGEVTPGGFGSTPVAGPIHGVRSRVRGEAYRQLFDQKDFGDWEFTVERLVAATGATTPDGLLRRADYDSLGRGFPYAPPGGAAGAGAPPPAPAAGSAPGEPPRPGAPNRPPNRPPNREVER